MSAPNGDDTNLQPLMKQISASNDVVDIIWKHHFISASSWAKSRREINTKHDRDHLSAFTFSQAAILSFSVFLFTVKNSGDFSEISRKIQTDISTNVFEMLNRFFSFENSKKIRLKFEIILTNITQSYQTRSSFSWERKENSISIHFFFLNFVHIACKFKVKENSFKKAWCVGEKSINRAFLSGLIRRKS